MSEIISDWTWNNPFKKHPSAYYWTDRIVQWTRTLSRLCCFLIPDHVNVSTRLLKWFML